MTSSTSLFGVLHDFVDPEGFVLEDFPEVLCVRRFAVADLDAESGMLGRHEMGRVSHAVVGNLQYYYKFSKLY